MRALLNSIYSRGKKLKVGNNNYEDAWCKFINYFKFETSGHLFDFSMVTDGCSFASLQFVREKKEGKNSNRISRRISGTINKNKNKDNDG